MNTLRMAVLAAVVAMVAPPAFAQDLNYRHNSDSGPDLLEGADGRPFWLLLGECAGFYGALSNTAANEEAYDQDLAQGVRFLNLSAERLQRDRQLDRAGAISVIEPHVRQARQVGETTIATANPGALLSPDQIMRSSCGSLDRVYAAQAG